MFIGNSDSPMWNRGWRAFSSSVTRQPLRASSVATVEPAGPPPMTSTSGVAGSAWRGSGRCGAVEGTAGDGLGLDSIDALELALAISKQYGFQLRSDSDENRRIFASLRALSAHIQQHRAG